MEQDIKSFKNKPACTLAAHLNNINLRQTNYFLQKKVENFGISSKKHHSDDKLSYSRQYFLYAVQEM